MRYLILPLFILLTGCAWFVSHPKIIDDLIEDETKAVEDVIRDSKGLEKAPSK